MADYEWRRVGTLSGPANVLNGRYRVQRAKPSSRWVVEDLTTGRPLERKQFVGGKGNAPGSFKTMAAARQAILVKILQERKEAS